MIVNLAETTRKNTDQDWLKTNIAKFTGMMQGQRDLLTVARLLLSELTPLVGAQLGTFYVADSERRIGVAQASRVVCVERATAAGSVRHGAGAGRPVRVGKAPHPGDRHPEGLRQDYFEPRARVLRLASLCSRCSSKGRQERSSSSPPSATSRDVHLAFLDQLTQGIGIVLNTIAATMRTEQLLKQSQALAEQLQKTNARAGGKGATAGRAEDRSRNQEPRSRAGQGGARREGRTAVAHFQVQERVPGQHEP